MIEKTMRRKPIPVGWMMGASLEVTARAKAAKALRLCWALRSRSKSLALIKFKLFYRIVDGRTQMDNNQVLVIAGRLGVVFTVFK
jgi:hypothetical protein